MTEIRTKRCLLRPPVLDDAECVTALVNDPRIYEKVARIPPGQSVEETGRWILNVQRGREAGTDYVFAITDVFSLGDGLAGMVGAHRQSVGDPYEIGYWLAPAAWGQGLATEAAEGLIGWLDIRGQADKLVSGYFKDNPASGRVLEKLGFRATHEAPVYCAGRGCEVDHVFMVREAQEPE